MINKKPKGFQKGVTTNPNGRPKGAIGKSTMLRREFEDNAEIDVPLAYKELRESMTAKEGWAHQIFWKELMPKKLRTVLIDKEKDRLEALLEGLSKFEELTHDEMMKEINILTSVKLASKIEETRRRLSLEEEAEMIEKIDFIIANAKKLNIN